jgi:hypothetical protein
VKVKPVLPPPTSIKLPEYWQQGCLVPQDSPTPKECVYGDTKHPVLTVALVGDSIAGNWFTPLEQIAEQRHWRLVTELHSACPLSATMTITPNEGGAYTACHSWGTAVMHDLDTTIKPAVVITSDLAELATVTHPGGGAAAQEDIGAGMDQDWKQLQDHGISVIAIRETPNAGINIPDCLEGHPSATALCTIPVSRAIQPHVPTVYATQAAGGSVPLINMNSLICGPASCPPVIGNVLVYQDNHHLTSSYALTMAPYLEQKLLRASKTLSGA